MNSFHVFVEKAFRTLYFTIGNQLFRGYPNFSAYLIIGSFLYKFKLLQLATFFYLFLQNTEKLRLRLAYPLLASCFAAWTVLLSKCVGELTKESVRSGTSEFLHFESFLILGGFVCSLPCQVMYINKGLSLFESSYIIPIFYSTWLIGSILMGALFWDEFAKTVVWQFLVFAGGVSCVMIGVVLLQQREISSESEQGGTEFDSAAGQHGRSGSSGCS